MGSGGREVGVASTPENTEMLISWPEAKESLMRTIEVECLGWKNVKKHGGNGKHLNPIRW